MSRSCVVVGAGPAGLSAAYRLANAGIRVTVLEGDSLIGGRTRSERVADFIVDTGAPFVTSFHRETLSLLRELNLETTEPQSLPWVVATPFGKLPLDLSSARRILQFPLISWGAKLRAMLQFGRAAFRRRSHIADLNSLARMDRGGTLENWGRRTLGQTGYDYLLRAGVEPYLYISATEASAALGKALVRHALKWQPLIVSGGTGSLCNALASRLEIRTGCLASAVETGEHSVTVHHSGGSIEADYVVLATPASAIVKMEGAISEEDRADLAAVRYLPNIVLAFGYDRPITVEYPWVTPAGPGRHPIARVQTVSESAPDRVPEGKELVYIYASGWRSAELLDLSPDKIVSALRTGAENIFGKLADPDWIRVYPRQEGVVLPAPRHYRKMQRLLKRTRGRVLYAGDWLTGSTIEGAVRTGFAAAKTLLADKS